MSVDKKLPVPLNEIGAVVAELIEMAGRNGADSRSMPDEYVAVAHFVSYPHEYSLDDALPPAPNE